MKESMIGSFEEVFVEVHEDDDCEDNIKKDMVVELIHKLRIM